MVQRFWTEIEKFKTMLKIIDCFVNGYGFVNFL